MEYSLRKFRKCNFWFEELCIKLSFVEIVQNNCLICLSFYFFQK